METFEKLLAWLLVNTLLPLLAVPLTRFAFLLFSPNRGWIDIVRDGQLCFYSTTLCAVAIEEVYKAGQPTTSLLTVEVSLIMLVVITAFIYGVTVVGDTMHPPPPGLPKAIGITSSLLTILTVVLIAIVRVHWNWL